MPVLLLARCTHGVAIVVHLDHGFDVHARNGDSLVRVDVEPEIGDPAVVVVPFKLQRCDVLGTTRLQ